MARSAVVVAFVAAMAAYAIAAAPATGDTTMSGSILFAPSDAKWGPTPPSLPQGAQLTVIEGDPSKPGPFTMQIKMPEGYKIPPHTHPTDERLTIVKGELKMGMGPTWNDREMKALTAGGFVLLPQGHTHYVVSKKETIVQVQSTGPFDIMYVNPADDPRNGPRG